MTWRKSSLRGSCRLLDYYMWPSQLPAQDGTGRGGATTPPPVPVPEGDPVSDTEESDERQSHPAPSSADRGKRSANSPAHFPTKPPPVKRQHGAEICSPMDAAIPTLSLAAFATTDNPRSEHSLKAMLLSLQADMQRKFRTSINHLHDRVDYLEENTDYIEQHLWAATTAHNTTVDIQDEHSEAIHQLRLKVADLEDCSRGNNIKIKGVPEAKTPAEIVPYQFFCKMLPTRTKQDLLKDRAHRIHKSQHLPGSLPRDILARINFFHSKEYIMRAARSMHTLPELFSKITLYNDISAVTSQVRKAFGPVTTILMEHKITYKWGFPTKLLVTYQRQQVSILTPKEGIKQLHNWGIIPKPPPKTPTNKTSTKISKTWATKDKP